MDALDSLPMTGPAGGPPAAAGAPATGSAFTQALQALREDGGAAAPGRPAAGQPGTIPSAVALAVPGAMPLPVPVPGFMSAPVPVPSLPAQAVPPAVASPPEVLPPTVTVSGLVGPQAPAPAPVPPEALAPEGKPPSTPGQEGVRAGPVLPGAALPAVLVEGAAQDVPPAGETGEADLASEGVPDEEAVADASSPVASGAAPVALLPDLSQIQAPPLTEARPGPAAAPAVLPAEEAPVVPGTAAVTGGGMPSAPAPAGRAGRPGPAAGQAVAGRKEAATLAEPVAAEGSAAEKTLPEGPQERAAAPGRSARAEPDLRPGPSPAENPVRALASGPMPPREVPVTEEAAGSTKSGAVQGAGEAAGIQAVAAPQAAAPAGGALFAPPVPAPALPGLAPAAPEASSAPRLMPRVAPAEQVAPIAIALALGGGAEGRITVSLDPVELGRVEVTVERVGEAARVQVAAERPETLALLARDGASLDRALGGAGIGGDGGRSISFSLLGTDAGGQGAGLGGSGTGPGGQEGGRGNRQGNGHGNGQAGPWRGAAGDLPETSITQRRALLGLLDIAI